MRSLSGIYNYEKFVDYQTENINSPNIGIFKRQDNSTNSSQLVDGRCDPCLGFTNYEKFVDYQTENINSPNIGIFKRQDNSTFTIG